MADETNLAEEVKPGVARMELRDRVREQTGPRHREVHVDEATWDYLMGLKSLFGLDNLRQAMVLVRHLAIHGTKRRQEEVEGG